MSSVVACSELIKFVLSATVVAAVDGHEVLITALYESATNSAYVAVPAFLYVLQSNLLFQGVQLLSPTVYMVCSQSKILASAFWSILLLKSRINTEQSMALVMLVCGMILVQSCDKQLSLNPSTESNDLQRYKTLKGLISVLGAAFTSGFAGAYLEKIYAKSVTRKRSIWFRNTQLACYSLPVAFLLTFYRDGTRLASNGFFQGYDAIVLVVVVLQAVGGIIVAVVLRQAGNMLKCFAVSISICLCVLFTMFSSDGVEHRMTLKAILGLMLVLSATFLYSKSTRCAT